MKKSILTLAIFASIFSLTLFSCDTVDDLTEVTFNTSLTEKIAVHVNQTSGTATSFNESIVLNLDNTDTHDYLNDINNISINSLSYKIINFSGDPTGVIDVEFFVDGVSLLTDDFIVKTKADSGQIFEVTNTTQLNQIASALKNQQQVTAKYEGTALCDANTMDFKVEVTIGISVIANPL